MSRPRPSGGEQRFHTRTKSFVRRSRKMSPGLQRKWEEYAPKYLVQVPRDTGWTSVAPDFVIQPQQLFGRQAPVVVEIGSGTGEQLVRAAQRWPDQDFIALEVWNSGLAKTVSKAVAAGVENLRLVEVDASLALPGIFPAESIAEVWTFFPDPWRKARHTKRRLVNRDFADAVAQVLRDGGLWRLATDWPDYAWQIREVIETSPNFENPHRGENPLPDDPEGARGGFAPRWPGRITTHFEQRGANEGRGATDFTAVRLPREPAPAPSRQPEPLRED